MVECCIFGVLIPTMEQDFDVIEVQNSDDNVATKQPSSLVLPEARPEGHVNGEGQNDVFMLCPSFEDARSNRFLVSAPVPKRRSSLARSDHLRQRRRSRNDSLLSVDNSRNDTSKSAFTSSRNLLEDHRLTSHDSPIHSVRLQKSTHKERRHKHTRRTALLHEPDEIKNMLKTLTPLYRRRLMIELVKSRWYLFALPLVILIVLGVVASVLVLPMLAEEKLIEVFQPPGKIQASWTMESTYDIELNEIFETMNTNKTQQYIRNVLKPEMLRIYQSLGKPIEDIEISSVSPNSGKGERKKRSAAHRNFIIEHMIIPSKNKTDYKSNENEFDLTDLVKGVRRELTKSKVIVVYPGKVSLKRGRQSVRSASVESFLQLSLPPMNKQSQYVDIPNYLPVHGGTKLKGCEGKPHFKDGLEKLETRCNSSDSFEHGYTCTIICVYLTQDLAVQCINGTWVQQNYCFKPCPFVTQDHTFSVWPFQCTGSGDNPLPIQYQDSCIIICREGYIPTADSTTKTCMQDGNWDVELADCRKSCPFLTPPMNGFVQPKKCFDWDASHLASGDVCTFSCQDSFVLEGEISTTCDSEGRWTEEVPVCRRKCKLLEIVPRSVVHPSACTDPAVFDGMSCSYTCISGTHLVGPNIRTCGHDGKWSEFPPECRSVCQALSAPQRGMVYPTTCSTSATVSPHTCSFSCDVGYAASTKIAVLTCLDNGEWDYPRPSCKSQCQPVSTPKNGSILCTGNVEDSTCKIYCNVGYKPIGATYIICNRNGIWSEPLGFCKKSCPVLQEVPYGRLYPLDCSMTPKFDGDICEYKCMPSYGYVGPREVTCLENGTWSANTTCVYQKMFMITMNYNNIRVCITASQRVPIKTDYHSCEYKHANFWSVVSGNLIKNAENGLCIGFEKAERMSNLVFLKCNNSYSLQRWTWPLASGMNYTMKIISHDLQLSYGYETSPNVVSTYISSHLTNWQLHDVEAEMTTSFFGILNNGKCFALSTGENGKWLPESCQVNAIKSGTKCSYLCTAGYEMEDETLVTCSNGVYTGNTKPKCTKSCPAFSPHSIKNGSVSPEFCTKNSYVRSGSICSFHCDPNFSIHGESNVACLMNGQWSTGQPHCKLQCPPLLPSTNLMITPSLNCPNPTAINEVGTTCSISCSKGYTIEGSHVIECRVDGTWNDTSYSCVRACPQPASPINGEVTCSTDSHPRGAICTFLCNGVMQLYPTNAKSIMCQDNGLWNDSTPTCQTFCPALPNVTAIPSSCFTSYSLPNFHKCKFECGINKKLVGEKEMVCLIGGLWNNALPTCVDDRQFLLTVEKNEVKSCVSVVHYKYESSYMVERKQIKDCAFNNSMDVWSTERNGLIRHVATDWCLGVVETISNEVFQLTECNSYDNRQRFECEFLNTQNLLKLRNSLYYLNPSEQHSSIEIQHTDKANHVSWIARDSNGNEGSVCGMLTNLGQCPELVLTTDTNISPHLCQNSVDIGINCTIVCEYGYELQSGKNSTTVSCLDLGIWSHSDINCKIKTCPKLTLPPNGMVSNIECINNNTNVWSDTACEISCMPGLYRKLVKGATGVLYCLEQGIWSEPIPECLEFCSALTAPSHGSLYPESCAVLHGRMHRDTCHFECDTHYFLTGEPVTMCNFGVWDISTPTCTQITGPNVCLPMASPDYGQIIPLECSFSSVSFNTSCRTSCDVGFIPSPSYQLPSFCQSNGKWTNPLAECSKLCPNLNSPKYSTVEPLRCRHGYNIKDDQCTVVCDPGYGLGYARTVTCLSNGQWDEPIMYCSKENQFFIEFKDTSSCLSAVDSDNDWVTKLDCGSYGDMEMKWAWLENAKIRNVVTQKCLTPENQNQFSPIVLKECSSVSHQWECSFDTNFQQKLSINSMVLMFMQNTVSRAFSIEQRLINSSVQPNTWNINARNETHEGSLCLFKSHGVCGKMPAMENGYIETRCQSQINILVGTKCKYYCNPGYEMVGGFQTICTEYGTWSNINVGSCQRLCPALSAPANVILTPPSCDNTLQQLKGTVCNFSCIYPYQLSELTSRVCRGDGKWTGVTPICFKPCPPVKASVLLKISPQDCSESIHNPGYDCAFKCPAGYHLFGSKTRTCQRDGIWTGVDGICTRSCAALSSIANGRILPLNCLGAGKVVSDTCVYTCNSMYSLTAERIRVCSAGLWSNTKPECKRICTTPNPPTNGQIICQKYPGVVGSKCTYTCSPDYVLDGESNERTCLENGFWSYSQPTCARSYQFLLLQSSPPNQLRCLTAISFKNVEIKEYQFCDINNSEDRWEWYHKKMIRNVFYRTCLAGRILPLESHLILNKCDDADLNQRWDCDDPNRPWFIRLTIPKLYPLYSALSDDKVLLYDSENLKFLQNFGQYSISLHTQWYAQTLEFNRTAVCTAVSESECSPLRAQPELNIVPPSCSLQTVLVGTECKFSCSKNKMVQSYIQSSTCLKQGIWSDDVPKCVAACPSISKYLTKHLKASPSRCLMAVPHPASATCKFTCSPNYNLLGSSVMTCMNNSKWTDLTPMCKITCPSGSALERGNVVPSICTSVSKRPVAGTKCHYVCLQDELKLNGPSTIECLSTGKWSHPEPTCQKPCRAIVPSARQKVIPASCIFKDSLADVVCAFSCEKEMIHMGSEYRVCLSNGSWSGIRSTCVTPCEQLENLPQNSMLNSAECLSSRMAPGLRCSISCLPGYERRGLQSVTCIENGTWSGKLGSCVKRCPKLSRPPHSILQPSTCLGDDIFQGNECDFSCQDKFIPKGENLKLCRENGEWTQGDFSCEPSCPKLHTKSNMSYQPKSCSTMPQIVGTHCMVLCQASYILTSGVISKTLTCKENGRWDPIPIIECIQACNKPTSKYGTFLCIDKQGKQTNVYAEGTVCTLTCNKNYEIGEIESSTCTKNSNLTAWYPSLPSCVYQPDSMIIFNRVEFSAVCFGEHAFSQIVLIDWHYCSTAKMIKWVWEGQYLIKNAGSGRCMAVSEPRDGIYLTTEICDESNTLQQWDCDDKIINTLKLGNFSLYVNIENGDGVVLRDAVSKRSLLYTFNPNGDIQIGSVCSMRHGSKCPKLWLPFYAQAVPHNCGSEGSEAGKTCGVQCDRGNEEIVNLTCDFSGTWTPDGKTVCRPLCLRHPLRDGVQFLEDKCDSMFVLSGTTCTLICTRGKVISRTITTTCSANLTWSPILPYQCNQLCPAIISVENGYVEPKLCSQEMCTVSCDAGYKIQGPKYRLCGSNGKWSGVNFTCVPDLQFRIVSVLEYKSNKLCLETNIYSLVIKRPCQANYKPQLWRWESDSLLQNVMYERCLIIGNSEAMPDLGESSILSNVTRSSDIGFDRGLNYTSKVITAKCNIANELQRWHCSGILGSKYSSLQQISTKLFLDSGPVFRTSLNIRQEKYKSTLWKGEHLTGSQNICGFRNSGVCSPLNLIYGGKIHPPICLSNLIVAGTRCLFECNGDFSLSGADYVVCLTNGEWSDKPPMCVGTEQCPELPKGTHLHIFPQSCKQNLVAEGTVCYTRCNENSVSVGESRITCVEGGIWNGSLATCDVRCPAIHPPKHGSIIPSQCEEGNIALNHVCNVTCKSHFFLIGSESRSCQEDGMLTGEQSYCVRKCEPIHELANGRVFPEICAFNSSNHGDSCTFKCHHGFALHGNHKLTCMRGEWSHIKPLCRGDFCRKISSLERGEITYSGLQNGAIVANSIMDVHCFQGYKMSGLERRLCLDNGKWEGGQEACVSIKCPALNEIYNGIINPPVCVSENSEISPGEYCYFSCNEGFKLSGLTSMQCPENGIWKYSEVPECSDTHSQPYFISFHIILRGKLVNESCLESTRNTVYPIIRKCEEENPFQLWNWHSSKNIQNVANKLCLKLQDRNILFNTCSTNDTEQTVTCASNNMPSSKYHVLINNLYLDENLNGRQWRSQVASISWVAKIKNFNHPAIASDNLSKETTLCNCMCGGILTSNSGDFSTPGFPNPYPSFVQCNWTIKTNFAKHKLRIGFSRMSLNNSGNTYTCQDSLFMEWDHETRICESSNTGFSISSMKGVINVLFDASFNEYHQNTGFSAHWTSIPWPQTKANCGGPGLDQAVHNHTGITPTQAPWQTMVMQVSLRACNAFLISERFVLAAAHCVVNFLGDSSENEPLIIYGFSNQVELFDRIKTRNFTKVQAIFTHPEFNANSLDSDIALVMSKTEMKLTVYIQPVCLSPYNMHRLTECFAVQWSTNMLKEVASEWRFTNVYELDILSECSQDLIPSYTNRIQTKRVCARLKSYEKRNQRLNDDGSLIQCHFNGNWFASGVTSYRINHNIDIYADLRNYYSWIKKTTERAFSIIRQEATDS